MSSLHSTTPPPSFLKLLAHELRWALVNALAASDRRVQELVTLVDRPINLVSYHLKQLRDQELVHERRSSADARDVYYSLNLEQLSHLYAQVGQALHPALYPGQSSSALEIAQTKPVRVLFLCTHNSARSQMAEGLLRALSDGNVEVVSAGSEPSTVHPLAVQVMADQSIDISQQRSTHMDEFTDELFDYVITVCDQVREECPIFSGEPCPIHWSLADPADPDLPGDPAVRFEETAHSLRQRIQFLLSTL